MTKKFAIAALAIALAGCASTPTSPPKLDLPSTTAQVQPSLARWWTAFGDPTLDKLVDEALANNLDLAAAMARVESARAQVLLSQADLFPTADLANRLVATLARRTLSHGGANRSQRDDWESHARGGRSPLRPRRSLQNGRQDETFGAAAGD